MIKWRYKAAKVLGYLLFGNESNQTSSGKLNGRTDTTQTVAKEFKLGVERCQRRSRLHCKSASRAITKKISVQNIKSVVCVASCEPLFEVYRSNRFFS